jgi:hypothetical protein
MLIIQDDRKRMIAHGHTAEKICDRNCGECAKDERIYNGLISADSHMLSDYTCPVGLTYGTRIEGFCEENPSEYHLKVVSPTARNLIVDSLGKFDPEKIKSDIRILREHLNSEEDIPIVKDDTLPALLVETPLALLKISLSPSLKRKYPRGLPSSLLL